MLLGKTFLKNLCKISYVCCNNSLFYLLRYSKFASRAATWRVLLLQLFRAVLTSYSRCTRCVAALTAMFFSRVVVVVVTFFNHNFVNCKATLIRRLKIYEIKYNISLNDVHT